MNKIGIDPRKSDQDAINYLKENWDMIEQNLNNLSESEFNEAAEMMRRELSRRQ